MKRILPESEFSAEQLNKIKELAAECDLCTETVKILYGRGICDVQSIRDFLHPSKERFISPFKMSGMREAVDLITRARDEGWMVLVYGDYDADGVSAATIMGNCLKEFGIEPALVIPERRNGYGLSVEIIDQIFEEYFPQLIITVDCGISCADEVEYIKEQGAEVIVTDHHELPAKIPDCICINPKFNDSYIYDNLCGAGVAFKVGCALLGEAAYKYLDFAAIATVADSVPLTGENRDIVYEGLKLINSHPRMCYSQFFKNDGVATSQTLAFSVAPKINAAGRMGDARSALDLFNAEDEETIYELAYKLSGYNTERQKYCDELYVSAKELLAKEGVTGKIIVLSGEGWSAGFVGIVAARLADEYCRPVILFVRQGEYYRGSARSVENVNIFEALKACDMYIDEYGGHSQAAGVNVSQQNFGAFKKAINDYISQKYSEEDFVPTIYISGTLTGEYSARFARELELMEPFGVGNKRPVFLMEEGACRIRSGKPSQHLSIKSDKIELMYFGGAKYQRLVESAAPKKYLFEYNVSHFRGKEYVKGVVRDLVYPSEACAGAVDDVRFNGVSCLALPPAGCTSEYISKEQVEEVIAGCPDFGTLFIAWDYSSVKNYAGAQKLTCELFLPTSKNNASIILVSPQPDADLSGFSRIICLDRGITNMPSLKGKKVEVCAEGPVPSCITGLDVSRQALVKSFTGLCAGVNTLLGSNAEEVVTLNGLPNPLQTLFALIVFEELKIISFKSGGLTIFKGIKTDLKNSDIYNKVCELQAEANQ